MAEKEENVFTIPLRDAEKKSTRRRSTYSVSIVKDYIMKKMKTDNVKIGKFLNEALWESGKKKAQRNVRVKLIKDEEVVKAELIGHDYMEVKQKPKKQAAEGIQGKLEERLSPKAQQNEELEKKIDGVKEEKDDGNEKKVDKTKKPEAAVKAIVKPKDE
jgi:ribosomal protein L31E